LLYPNFAKVQIKPILDIDLINAFERLEKAQPLVERELQTLKTS
jgi:hypothetical protein